MQLIDKVIMFCKINVAKDEYIELNPETNLIENFSIDSLNCIEILVKVEKQFGIRIEDDDCNMSLLETPYKLCEYIRSHGGKNND